MNVESITQEIPRPEDRKPWLSPREQVERLKSQGVKFEGCSEADAEEYLRNHANYCRLKKYCPNFPKHVGGKRDGMFVNLDFKMLVDLLEMDTALRVKLLEATLCIESRAKADLLACIKGRCPDGYEIVWDFAKEVPGNEVLSPVWEYVDALMFGRFLKLYEYCGKVFGDSRMKRRYYILQSVRSLRNKCAHNHLLLADLRAGETRYAVSNDVLRALQCIGVGLDSRSTKMKNESLRLVSTTLFLYSRFELGGSRGALEWRRLADYLAERSLAYPENTPVRSSLEFVNLLITKWASA